jgi:hypothetical protein
MTKLLQRPEVWVLLLMSVGAAWFVLAPKNPSDTRWSVRNQAPASGEATALQRMTLERDHGNARLDLELRFTNPHSKTLQLVAPLAILKTSEGQEVPAFFLPIEPPPSIPAKTTADIRLRFWLDPEHFKTALILELDGTRIPIKSAAAFDLTQLENTKPVELGGPEWTVNE